jgi:hypothetical protein
MALEGIPAILRHCTLAIFEKLRGDPQTRFKNAFAIARAHLVKHGYLADESDIGTVENIRLTLKGRRREQKHLMEGSKGDLKNARFMELFRVAELGLTEESRGEPQVRTRDEREGHAE